MRIGIDCRLAGINHAGIGRYVSHLVQELCPISQSHELILFCSSVAQATELLSSTSQNKTRHVQTVITPISHYSLQEQWRMCQHYSKAKLDLLHVPHFNVPLFYDKPFVVTIHDLLWHHHKGHKVTNLPAWLYWPKYLAYRLVASHAIAHAQAIVVPSATVKTTLTNYYPQSNKKISVVTEGVSLAPPQRPSFKLPQSYLLYVGSLYPHKNVDTILSALSSLENQQLLLVGSRSIFSEQIKQLVQKLGLSSRVHFLHQVSDAELHWLYQHAVALLQPSSSEGFGLTGVEAMAAGTSVVASDIPIFREIYSKHAYYFTPRSVAGLLQAVTAAQQSNRATRRAAQQFVSQYSWSRMAKQILQLYENTNRISGS